MKARFAIAGVWYFILLATIVEAQIKRPCWARCFYTSPAIKEGPWQKDQFFTPNFNLTSWYDTQHKGSRARSWKIFLKDFAPIGVGKLYLKPNEKNEFHIGFAGDPVKIQDVYSGYHPGEIIGDLEVTMDVVVNNGRIGGACNAASLKYNLPAKWTWEGRIGNAVIHRGRWRFTKSRPLEILDGHYDLKFPYQDRSWSVCIAFYFAWRTYAI